MAVAQAREGRLESAQEQGVAGGRVPVSLSRSARGGRGGIGRADEASAAQERLARDRFPGGGHARVRRALPRSVGCLSRLRDERRTDLVRSVLDADSTPSCTLRGRMGTVRQRWWTRASAAGSTGASTSCRFWLCLAHLDRNSQPPRAPPTNRYPLALASIHVTAFVLDMAKNVRTFPLLP